MGRDYLGGAGAAAAADEPLLGGGGIGAPSLAPASSRPRRDVFWSVAFLTVLTCALAGGIYAGANHNADVAHAFNVPYLSDPANCPARPPQDSGGSLRRRLLGALSLGGPDDPTPPPGPDPDAGPSPSPPPAVSLKQFLGVASAYVALSVAGGAALGVGAMALFRAMPHAAVYGAIALQIAIPLSAGAAALASGAPFAAATPALLAALLVAFVYYLYREQLGLVARLLGTAAQAVSRVWGVVVAAAGIQLASALVCAPLAASALLAYANGHIVPSPLSAGPAPATPGGGGGADATPFGCVTESGDPTACCAWRPEPWAMALIVLCSVALTWASLLAFCVKTYVVSGAVAQWYFAPAGSAPPRDATKTALANALGPSFGSCALAAWLLACISWARQALQQLKQNARDSFLAQILLSCVDALYAILEQLSKFGVVMAAITGEPFLEAARRSTSLLSRNLLDTAAVWVFPANVVGLTNFALASAWGALAGASSFYLAFAPAEARAASAAAAAGQPPADAPGSLALPLAGLVGAFAFAFGLAALSFLASVLLSAVDAVYLCFAIDRDRAMVSRGDVHEVMVLLPASKKAAEAQAAGAGGAGAGGEGPGGGIVEQPGGGYAFGAGRPAAV